MGVHLIRYFKNTSVLFSLCGSILSATRQPCHKYLLNSTHCSAARQHQPCLKDSSHSWHRQSFLLSSGTHRRVTGMTREWKKYSKEASQHWPRGNGSTETSKECHIPSCFGGIFIQQHVHICWIKQPDFRTFNWESGWISFVLHEFGRPHWTNFFLSQLICLSE